ncbi:TetR/AcrR family transcriptional regulator [Lactiplantibacillus daowaiensis]|uniref:TetR/AcrR family transcriptional regulator n=1 Tax=Lactiplantibacillus daowaiensis TaxID=2559918 RepID=A0ABW1S3R8_9LACO
MAQNKTVKTHIRTAQINQTKQDFMTALTQLMADKPLVKISVAAVVTRAGYARRTFYRHFTTLDDVLRQRIDELTLLLYGQLSQQHTILFEETVQTFFSFWEPYQDFLKLLAQNNRLYLLEESWRKNLAASQLNELTMAYADYFQQFALGGMFAMLSHWIQQGAKESPQAMVTIATAIRRHLN